MARRRKQVSEKTLELNICANILEVIRSLPGCTRAFLVGLKQEEEARVGADSWLKNVPRSRFMVFQFKAPWFSPGPDKLGGLPSYYRFTLNSKQHNNLRRLVVRRGGSIAWTPLYVLPHYNRFSTMITDAPNFLTATWFARVVDIKGDSDLRNPPERHDAWSRVPSKGVVTSSVQVFSEPNDTPTFLLHAALQHFDVDNFMLPGETLEHWVTTWSGPSEGRSVGRAELLGSLKAICIPN